MQIEKRSVGVCILLTIVTCGIYGIIWAVKMLKEAVQVKDETDSGTAEILLGIFLCPVGFYMAEKKLTEGCQMRGIPHEDRSTLYIILGFLGLGIVDYIMLQSDLNGIADMYAPGAAYAAPQQPYQAPQQPYQAPQQPYQAPQQPYQAPQQPYQAPQQADWQRPNANPYSHQGPVQGAPQQPQQPYQPPQGYDPTQGN